MSIVFAAQRPWLPQEKTDPSRFFAPQSSTPFLAAVQLLQLLPDITIVLDDTGICLGIHSFYQILNMWMPDITVALDEVSLLCWGNL